MIITCPHCTTRYRVSAIAFGAAARAVRCSNCGHLWTIPPPQVGQAVDRPARQRGALASAEALPGRQLARQELARSFQNVQRKTEANRKPPVQPDGRNTGQDTGRNGLIDQPDAQAAPLIVAPMTDTAAPPTADGQEVAARAQPEGLGGGASAADYPQDLHRAPPATELPEIAEAHIPAPDERAPEQPASAPARRRRAAFVALAIVLLIIGLGILVWERDAVMAAASRLTALVGLEGPPGADLEIGAVTSVREETADGDMLVVRGTVSNLTDEARPLPVVRVSLLDTNDTELQHVMVTPDREVLAASESLSFSARLEQPAPTARRIKVTFAARSASN